MLNFKKYFSIEVSVPFRGYLISNTPAEKAMLFKAMVSVPFRGYLISNLGIDVKEEVRGFPSPFGVILFQINELRIS